MKIKYISPLSELNAEVRPFFSNENMISSFKKFCVSIRSRMRSPKIGKNAKYNAEDFLRVFFYSEITGRSIDSASERLNRYLMGTKRGRRKIFVDGRKERVVPHQTDVNRFLRKIGLRKAKNILRECLDNQLMEALKLGLISKKVNILIDFTEHDYYGKRRDKMIIGTNRGRGTSRMRHYLGFSIISGDTHLFAGLEHVAKGQAKTPVIMKFIEHIINLGFEVGFVMADREFYQAEFASEVKRLKSDVLMPSKAYPKVKGFIDDYLKGKGKRIRRYTISSAPGGKKAYTQSVYLIIKAKKGYSLSDVKKDLKAGKLTLTDAKELLYAIITTRRPRGDKSSWACRTAGLYRRRWNIETGFSDLNRIGRRWKSKFDNTRYLDMLVRMLLYNSWKINRTYLNKREKYAAKRNRWTLQMNQDSLEAIFMEA